ncbi:MAG: HAD family hydrolase [Candidatus Wallbacteria bacterium]|nr:HAD family hydrolase [Candidatus Wallbacteria bacterium]
MTTALRTRFIRKSLFILLMLAGAAAAFARGKALPPDAQSKLLAGILAETAKAAAAGKSPAVAFDIDDTLLLTAPRTKAILLEFAGKHAERYPGFADQVSRLDPNTMPHGIAEVLKLLEIGDQERVTELKKYWLPRFLSNDYLTFDWPLPGSLEFIVGLRAKGAAVFYVTARSPEKMREGTEKALRHFGFPLDERAQLLMNDTHKPAPEFKGKRTAELAKTHRMTGLFENEPDNINAMHRADPKAQAVFLDTVHGNAAGPVDEGVPWIKNYRLKP